MTITINLPPETEEKLLQAAARNGIAPDAYARELIETVLGGGSSPGEHTRPETFDEILAPVRKGFEESGMTEEELTVFFEEAREEASEERQRRKGT